jgi:hypothetical protein
MRFLIVPKLNLIVGWNPKVACTTIKYLLLTKLGHNIEGNIHIDMLTKKNLESGKYDIYDLKNPKFKNIDLNSYTKICVIRNPYERLISGIRQRSSFLVNDLKWIDVSKNTITEFLHNLKTHDYIEDHFKPQTNDINNFKFDHVFSLDQMEKIYKIIELPYLKESIGDHITRYTDNDKVNYYNLTIQDIYNKTDHKWSSNINSWFTHDNIQLINELYKDDFEWLSKNGFDYKIN